MSKLFNSISLGIPMVWGSHPLKESENAKPQGIQGPKSMAASSCFHRMSPPWAADARIMRSMLKGPGSSTWETVTIVTIIALKNVKCVNSNGHIGKSPSKTHPQKSWCLISGTRNHPPNHQHHQPTFVAGFVPAAPSGPRGCQLQQRQNQRCSSLNGEKCWLIGHWWAMDPVDVSDATWCQCGVASWKGREWSRMLCMHIRKNTVNKHISSYIPKLSSMYRPAGTHCLIYIYIILNIPCSLGPFTTM